MTDSWEVYAWYDEEGEPYWISKCRVGAPARHKKRAVGRVQPPEDRSRIRTLYESSNEEEVLQKLDYFHYLYALKDAAPGFGKLENSVHRTNNTFREHNNNRAIPVSVYDLKGNLVGNFNKIVDAVRTLGLSEGSANETLHKKQYSHRGYVICHRGEPFPERTCRHWRSVPVWGMNKDSKEIRFFDNVPDAAAFLNGNREHTSKIWNSVKSPMSNKSLTKNWCFFDTETAPSYDSVVFARRGRKVGFSPKKRDK